MRKLAIVGTHPRTRADAPWEDEAYDIWVFNEAPQQEWCKRWSLVFQMHKPEVYTSLNNFVNKEHWPWLQQSHGKPIVMQDVDSRVPDSVRYPLDEIMASIPGANLRWWKSTPAYALAYALYLGYEEVELYGLDMASNTEYGYQLPNFQFWIGVCLGAGMKIPVLSNEQFFTGSLYAYEGEIQIDRGVFSERAKMLKAEYKKRKWTLDKVTGELREAIDKLNFVKTNSLIAEVQDAVMALGEVGGALDVAEKYSVRDDLIPRQEFERRAAEAQRDAEEKRREMWVHQGEVQYTWNAWKGTGSGAARDQMKQFTNAQIQAAEQCGIRTGAMRENAEYMQMIDDLITAAGGQRTLAALGAQ